MAYQSAWAAARTKNTYLSAQFKKLAALRGRLVHFSAHPQMMQQHRQLSCRGDSRTKNQGKPKSKSFQEEKDKSQSRVPVTASMAWATFHS